MVFFVVASTRSRCFGFEWVENSQSVMLLLFRKELSVKRAGRSASDLREVPFLLTPLSHPAWDGYGRRENSGAQFEEKAYGVRESSNPGRGWLLRQGKDNLPERKQAQK